MFSMISPNLSNPYLAEFKASGVTFSEKALIDSLREQKLPGPDVKYESFGTTQWWQIEDVFKLYANYLQVRVLQIRVLLVRSGPRNTVCQHMGLPSSVGRALQR